MKNQAYEIGKFGIVPPLPKVFDDYDFEEQKKVLEENMGFSKKEVIAK